MMNEFEQTHTHTCPHESVAAAAEVNVVELQTADGTRVTVW